MLTLSGGGFDDSPARMQVVLRESSGATIATCSPLWTSSSNGTLACQTTAATDTNSAAGQTYTVSVASLDSEGSVVAEVNLAGAYRLLSVAQTPFVTTFTPTSGSAEGGTSVCIEGRMGSTTLPQAILSAQYGDAPCDVADQLSLGTGVQALCCTCTCTCCATP